MQPSSLIFVLVVAIWAVYLLQYWIKRRDHLATVRSVDRFSAAMRVLDDHRMHRVSEPTPRSYAVAPTRAARPEVTVKHADSPGRGPVVTPVVGASRRLRGLTVLTMLTLLPVVALVAAFGPLPWWTAAVWLVGTVAAFGWLRQAVQVERAATAQARAEQRRAAAVRVQRPVARTRTQAAPAAPAPPQRQVYDVDEAAAEAAPPVAETSPAEPGTWEPTPVPRPMYTMKAKAERPEPAPLETERPHAQPAAEVPQVIDVEDEELPAIAGWG